MGIRTFVAGETLTAANINTYLMNQAVIVCTSGTRPASPVDGMTIYETDTDRQLTYDGTNWLNPDNVAGGTLGYAQVIADQTGITTETDLTGLTVAVTVGAGRRIRVTASVLVYGSVVSDEFIVNIKEGATVLQRAGYDSLTGAGTSRPTSVERSVVLTPSAGSHTYKLSLLRNQGTGSLTSSAGTTFPAFILVEDIGV